MESYEIVFWVNMKNRILEEDFCTEKLFRLWIAFGKKYF